MIAEERADMLRAVCERPRPFKVIVPSIEGVTGDLLYAGTYGWIFQSLHSSNQIVKVSKFADMCEHNRAEFHVAKYVKRVLALVNERLATEEKKNIRFSSTIVDDAEHPHLNSTFRASSGDKLCFYNQMRLFPCRLRVSRGSASHVLTNLVQLLPGRSGDMQLRCTGKTAAAERWSEIYDPDVVKAIVNECGMDGDAYGDAVSFLHGCFIGLGVELNDVEFIVGSPHPDANTPELFLLDFDKVKLLSEDDKRKLVADFGNYTHPTIVPFHTTNATANAAANAAAMHRGREFATRIREDEALARIRSTSPCFVE